MTARKIMRQMFRRTGILLAVLVLCILLLKPCIVQASDVDAESWNLRVVSDLSVYSANVTIAWDMPSGERPADYCIYVNGSERYVSGTNSFSFHDMAPNTDYRVMIKARDSAGYQYGKSETITISTGYHRMLLVGEGETYTDIQAAINASGPGDVILIKDGHYTGSFSITAKNAGNEDKWITMMAEGKSVHIYGNVTLKAGYYRIAGLDFYGLRSSDTPGGYELFKEGSKVNGITVSADHIQLVGLSIRDAFNYAIRTSGDSIYVADNYIKDTCSGIAVFGSNSLYERNEIESIGTYNYLRMNDDVDYFRVFGLNQTIRGNYCHGVVEGDHLQGAHVDFVQSYDVNQDVARDILIENNLVYGYIGQGLMLSNGKYPESHFLSDWTVRNNIFVGFHSWAVNAGTTTGSVPGMIIVNNLFIGRTEPELALNGPWSRGLLGSAVIQNNIIMNSHTGYGAKHGAVLIAGGNNLLYNVPKAEENEMDIIGKDPMFVDMANGDFHLRPNSPAIDAGAENGIRQDMEGTQRNHGERVDIGPYEFTGIREEQPAERVVMSTKELLLGVGDRKTLHAVLAPYYTTDREVLWKSSAPAVVSVDADGKLTALSKGTAEITVQVKNRAVYDTCLVTVKELPNFRGITCSPDILKFDVSQTVYEVDIPYDCEAIMLQPEYISGMVSINGTVVASGTFSARIPMKYGENTVSVRFNDGDGGTMTYTVILSRVDSRWWIASEGFSNTQGKNDWYYRMFNGSRLLDLQWSEENSQWIYTENFGCNIKAEQMTPAYKKDVERVWKAPYEGEIGITGRVQKESIEGRGVNVIIKKNDEILWGPHLVLTEEIDHDITTQVKAGDTISFIVDSNGRSTSEPVLWNPKVTMKESVAETECVELDSKVLALEIEDTHMLVATLVPKRPLHRELVWSSSNESVVTVDAKGTIEALSIGSAIITVSVRGTNLSAACEVKVLRSWTASKGFSSIQGENNWYYYMLEDGEYKELTWSTAYEQWLQGSPYGCSVAQNRQQPEKGQDAVRIWEAPSKGRIAIRGNIALRRADGDGIVVTIKKNESVLWGSRLITDTNSVTHLIYTEVEDGDRIFFESNSNIESTVDRAFWDPTITYVDTIKIVGDMNGDGIVDIADTAFIAENIGKSQAGSNTTLDWTAIQKADVNDDGLIDIVDLSMVAKLLY